MATRSQHNMTPESTKPLLLLNHQSASSSQTTTTAMMDMDSEGGLISPESINVEIASTKTALSNLIDQANTNTTQLANRKRSSHLNHSLNESDLPRKKYQSSDANDCESDLEQIAENNLSHEEEEEANPGDSQKLQFKKSNALHKSKRSIKTIEQTLKNSKSIEKWLDKVSNEEAATTTLSYRKQQMKLAAREAIAVQSTGNHLDLNVDLKTNLKLAENVKKLIELNAIAVSLAETQMSETIQKFMLPNSEDKAMLKWLISDQNFAVTLLKPCLNEQAQSFIITPTNLNITVVDQEKDKLNDSLDTLDEQSYFKFNPQNGRLIIQTQKIERVLGREKELAEQQSLSNNLSKEKLDEFRAKYIETPNFVGAQCFMSMAKRKSSSLQKKSASSLLAEPVEVSYSDLSEKLFACFLSNYSCELSEYFLDSAETIDTFGFVRKHYSQEMAGDKSFSFVTLENETAAASSSSTNAGSSNSSMTAPNLKVTNVRFGFRLDKWPAAQSGGFTFVQRLSNVLSKKLLNTLDISTCLIVTGNLDDFL
jgi:hypothetical protein